MNLLGPRALEGARLRMVFWKEMGALKASSWEVVTIGMSFLSRKDCAVILSMGSGAYNEE